MKSSDLKPWGLSWRRATYLCNLLYLPAPGRGKTRTLSDNDLRLLLITDTLLELFKRNAAVDMALKLKALAPDLSSVGLVYWIGKEHRCTLTPPPADNNKTVLTLSVPNAIRRSIERKKRSE